MNSGCLKALNLGFKYLITIDADGQHNTRNIKKLCLPLESGFDLVAGIRPYNQRFSEKFFAFYTRFRWNIYDPLCGLKAYKTSLIKMNGCFDSYDSIGTEILLYALHNKKNILQLKISMSKRKGNPKFGNFVSANYKIIRSLLFAFFIDLKYFFRYLNKVNSSK